MFSLIPKFSPPPHPPSLNILLFCPSFLLPHSSLSLPSHLRLVSSLRPLLPPTANRTEPNIQDLAMAFSDLGINTAELLEFCREVESQKPPQDIPKYPVPKKSTHVNLSTPMCASTNKRVLKSSQSSTASSDEEEDEEGHIPSYLPPLPGKKESEKGTATALYGMIYEMCY